MNTTEEPMTESDAPTVHTHRIADLPREVGVMLVTVGVIGVALPGLVGTPAMLAGGLVLWPNAFGKIELWFEKQFPNVHRQGLRQINRYLDDLEKRYPDTLQEDAKD